MTNRDYIDTVRLLLDVPHLQDMPAIRWKLANLQRLSEVNPSKFVAQEQELRRRLES